MDSNSAAYSIKYDLSNCENEPIHLIRLTQAHACLIACDPTDFSIIQVSDNTEAIIGYPPDKLLQSSLVDILPKDIFEQIKKELTKGGTFRQINPLRTNIYYQDYTIYHHLIVHVNPDGVLIVDIEPIDNQIVTTKFQYILSDAIQNIQKASYEQLFDQMAREIKIITGFDRVMVYRFDENNDGEVIAEAKEDFVEPYLGLKYPASDIPPQARALYLKNKTRILANVGSTSARIIPVLAKDAKKPLDLTYSVTRGLSPIHLEYLRNMGVQATMSVSIILDDRLWGLIACHHFTPKFLDYSVRFTCQFMTQILSGHLALESANLFRTSVLKTNLTRAKLFESMSEDYNVFDGLTQDQTLMHLVDCSGAAVITEHQVSLLGTTPSEEEVKELCEWLDDKTDTLVFETNSLLKLYKPAKEYKEKSAGILAIKFALNPNEFIIWFRPEVTQEVYWGGNPNKAMSKNGERLSPRKSFQKWKEIVKGLSRRWEKHEIDAAIALRNDIREFIMQRFNEIKQLNKQMEAAYQELETFSYSVSHDLRSPLRKIDGFTQILKEDYGDKMDEWGTEILNTIMESTKKMNTLINDILNFSRLGRKSMDFQSVSAQELVDNAFKEVLPINKADAVEIRLPESLPNLWGDKPLLQQLFTNLISNAVKYSQKESKPIIEIGSKQIDNHTFINIKDNGIGMDMKYSNKVFGVFDRLVSEEEYPGTGIGLAIVHRIITRHEGEVSVESKIGKETTFWVKLPNRPTSQTFDA